MIDTNLYGYVHGAGPPCRGFGARVGGADQQRLHGRHPGRGHVAPDMVAKRRIRSLGMTLRQELALNRAHGIQACMVMPVMIDTTRC